MTVPPLARNHLAQDKPVFPLECQFLMTVKWTTCFVSLTRQQCMKAALTQQSCCCVCCAKWASLFLLLVAVVGVLSIATYGRSIVTDEYLCVKGSKGTIFAMGDAATVEQPKALDRAKVLPCPALPDDVLFSHTLDCPLSLPCLALSCPGLPALCLCPAPPLPTLP